MTRRLLVLHGHFYQPPRENPWIEEIEVQDSAEPFHDWNERVTAECYGPNGAARVKDGDGRILDIIDNYRRLSFDFGPTLLAWLERRRPDAYARVLAADAASVAERGAGNAVAQGYNHAILPLCSPRDRRTQIRWGVEDFRRRFHRDPEGMWLPETAADAATLADLAEAGIRFTVLSPYQAARVRPPGGDWQDASGGRFDPTRPYRVRAGGRELAVFFYDGPVARDLAFGGALSSPDALADRIHGAYDPGRRHDEVLVVAVDGETLGHHKKGGDEALAAAWSRLAARGVEAVNLSQALRLAPPEWEAEIVEGSSWSCAHGIERWRSDCGCSAGGEPGWRQAWRAPLREAIRGLRDGLAVLYERETAPLLQDPWGARDRFVELVLDPERRDAPEFLRREAGRVLGPGERVKALRLLEMQRQTLLMETSCGWFFAELSGIESVQILKYAARACQLARDAAGVDLEPRFVAALARAPSNVPELRDGRGVYEARVRPSVVTLEGIGAHLAVAVTARDAPELGRVFCYRYRLQGRRRAQSGPATLELGRVELRSELTHNALDALYSVVHLGAADFRCGLLPYPGPERHAELERDLFARFERFSFSRLIRELDRTFPGRDYTLRDLFLDERRRVAEVLLQDTIRRYEGRYREMYEDSLRLLEFLREIDSPIPGPLRVAADVTLTGRILEVTRAGAAGTVDLGRAEAALAEAVELARRLGAHLHLAPVRHDVETIVAAQLGALVAGRAPGVHAAELSSVLDLAARVGLHLDLWDAQNRFWDWTGSGRVGVDRETLALLARLLWLDEGAALARAGFAPARVPAAAG